MTSQTVATSPTTSIAIALPTGTIKVDAATWAGGVVGAATVTITGGPNSPTSYTGTTDAAGVANVDVPTTTASYPYTVTVTQNGGSGSATVTSLAAGATATVAPPCRRRRRSTLTVEAQRLEAQHRRRGRAHHRRAEQPTAYGGTFTTDGKGKLSPITVPSGSGNYTVDVWLSNCSLYSTYRSGVQTGVSSTGTSNTNATVDMDVSGAACPRP